MLIWPLTSYSPVLSLSEVEILWAHSQRNLYFPINLFPEMTLEVKQRRWLEVRALSGALTLPEQCSCGKGLD